jgi:hypothetical protein
LFDRLNVGKGKKLQEPAILTANNQ